jgi:hypothetical protein
MRPGSKRPNGSRRRLKRPSGAPQPPPLAGLAAEFTAEQILLWEHLPPADRIREGLIQQLVLVAIGAPDLELRMDASKYLLGFFSPTPTPAPAPYGPESPQVGAAIASMNSILVAAGIPVPGTRPGIELETEHVGHSEVQESGGEELGEEDDKEGEDDDSAV